MLYVQRIYHYQPHIDEIGLFIDRLYPRGIAKERMEQCIWLKDLAPSTALRRWYHQDIDHHFEVFADRYRIELQTERAQIACSTLSQLQTQYSDIVLLTAVKQPQRSHISVLLDVLHQHAIYR